MNFLYQIVYREHVPTPPAFDTRNSTLDIPQAHLPTTVNWPAQSSPGSPLVPRPSPLQVIELIVDHVRELEELATLLPGVEIVSKKNLGAPILAHQPTFTRHEAASYLRCSTSQIDVLCGEGKLPKAKDGFPIFHRRDLDRVIAGEAGEARGQESGVRRKNKPSQI